MKGLLCKEFCLIRCSGYFLLIPVIVLTAVITGKTILLTYVGILFALLPVTLMTADETSRWEQYSLGMPYSRSTVVSAKYLTVLLLSLLAAAVLLAAAGLISLRGCAPFSETAPVCAASLFLGLLIPAVMYPLNFKLGTTRARAAVLVGGACLSCFGAAAAAARGKLPVLTEKLNSLTPVLIAAAVLLLFAASWMLSVLFYRRREF